MPRGKRVFTFLLLEVLARRLNIAGVSEEKKREEGKSTRLYPHFSTSIVVNFGFYSSHQYSLDSQDGC